MFHLPNLNMRVYRSLNIHEVHILEGFRVKKTDLYIYYKSQSPVYILEDNYPRSIYTVRFFEK